MWLSLISTAWECCTLVIKNSNNWMKRTYFRVLSTSSRCGIRSWIPAKNTRAHRDQYLPRSTFKRTIVALRPLLHMLNLSSLWRKPLLFRGAIVFISSKNLPRWEYVSCRKSQYRCGARCKRNSSISGAISKPKNALKSISILIHYLSCNALPLKNWSRRRTRKSRVSSL